MIKITMGGYLDKNDKVMTRAELNEAISEMQDENKKLRECVEVCSENEAQLKNFWDKATKRIILSGFKLMSRAANKCLKELEENK